VPIETDDGIASGNSSSHGDREVNTDGEQFSDTQEEICPMRQRKRNWSL